MADAVSIGPAATAAGPPPTEAKVALVPRVAVTTLWTDLEYALLLTDGRTLFVLERTVRQAVVRAAFVVGLALVLEIGIGAGMPLGFVLLPAVGAGVVAAWAIRRGMPRTIPDYSGRTTESLAGRAGTFVVPHANLERLEFVRPRRGDDYVLRLVYRDAAGRTSSFAGRLLPQPGWTADRRAEGLSRRASFGLYARSVRDAFWEALPRDAVSRLREAA